MYHLVHSNHGLDCDVASVTRCLWSYISLRNRLLCSIKGRSSMSSSRHDAPIAPLRSSCVPGIIRSQHFALRSLASGEAVRSEVDAITKLVIALSHDLGNTTANSTAKSSPSMRVEVLMSLPRWNANTLMDLLFSAGNGSTATVFSRCGCES